MAPDRLLAFALLAFALIVVPGPSVLFIVGRALSAGRRTALATVLGNAGGEYLQAAGVALGLGVVLAQSELVFTIVKLAGAGYLAYLGIQTIRKRRSLAVPPSQSARPYHDRRAFRDGLIVGLTNPKTTVFFVAVLPQFVTRVDSAGPVSFQMLLLGLVFVAIALVSDSAWALGASQARSWFVRSPRRLENLSAAGGCVMIGLAAGLALTKRTD
jgi:threonine/homoserine/homoserine lactone efflux protein